MDNKKDRYYTEQLDWEIHWRKFKPFNVIKSNIEDLCKDFPPKGSFLEIGGFPGVFSVYFKKYLDYDVYLLDYIIVEKILSEMEIVNGLQIGAINRIKTDFFNYKNEKRFDIVFSYGFIEHFENTIKVIKKHIELLNENGNLLVILPNLKGISGFFLKLTDFSLYKKHNLNSMNLELLYDICSSLGLRNLEVKYYGKPHIWINTSSKFDGRLTRTLIKYFNGFSQKIPITNKFFSPLIAIKGIK